MVIPQHSAAATPEPRPSQEAAGGCGDAPDSPPPACPQQQEHTTAEVNAPNAACSILHRRRVVVLCATLKLSELTHSSDSLCEVFCV